MGKPELGDLINLFHHYQSYPLRHHSMTAFCSGFAAPGRTRTDTGIPIIMRACCSALNYGASVYVCALYRDAVTCATPLGVLFVNHSGLILRLNPIAKPEYLSALGVFFAPHATRAYTSAIFPQCQCAIICGFTAPGGCYQSSSPIAEDFFAREL